jgi:hypothetical protein
MKQIYNKFCDFMEKDDSGIKWAIFFVVIIMLVMFVLDKADMNLDGRGGNPQNTYQGSRY